ncbi:MAG: TRAM domain-containing protein [Candidatus Woesearchaeota archaeon]|jgi:predicted RNA-binding protein with TRAM domain|nr:TRAM domain-containing protein [Candidatus Woesearchaeota archaeon]MDP7198899.1 TRAM domain-containing protein [Candidatus Woesearchaeota archaeon]MDP7647777.1 TRAM domain-containing protein [Candidatus Woesearchaeota archaeon]|tara:strand:+ start:60 stop:365 length:306 start_codon:yes stop_codon:yes gene_type:complete
MEQKPPVSVGEEIDVTIEAVGEKGDGIAKKEGFVLFVPGVKEGDQVRIKITKVLNKVGFAEVVDGEGGGDAGQDEGSDDSDQAADEQPEASAEDSEDFGEE